MSWEHSLVRIADFEVEQLRKRLAEILDRRQQAEFRLTMLHAEAEAEAAHADEDAEAGFYRIGFLQGWRARRDTILAEIAQIGLEEEGARDALTAAFEDLKKYETVAENARAAQRLAAAKRERAVLDELGLRRAASR